MFLGLILFGYISYFLYVLYKANATLKWIQTDALTLSSNVGMLPKLKYTQFIPNIEYQFKVDGKTYKNNTLCFYFGTPGFNEESSRLYVNKYPKGSKIPIYYNPSNPEKSVIISGLHQMDVLKFLALVFGIVLFILVFLFLE